MLAGTRADHKLGKFSLLLEEIMTPARTGEEAIECFLSFYKKLSVKIPDVYAVFLNQATLLGTFKLNNHFTNYFSAQ